MSVQERIRTKLETGLSPDKLVIVDESAAHAGHAGARPGGETHFRVEIVASAFEGQSRLARQRAVYGLLDQELAGPVHALSVTARTPAEVAA